MQEKQVHIVPLSRRRPTRLGTDDKRTGREKDRSNGARRKSTPNRSVVSEWTIEKGGIVEGWLTNAVKPQKVPAISVEIDGVVCARVKARTACDDVARRSHDRRLAFRFEIPLAYYAKERFSVALRFGDGEIVPGNPISVEARDRFRGRVIALSYDHVSVCIRGFAFDRMRPDSHLVVEAVIDGTVVGRALACLSGLDGSAPDGPGGDHGFLLSLNCGGEAFADRGQVRLADVAVVLPSDLATIFDQRNHPTSSEPRAAIVLDCPSTSNIVGAVDGTTARRYLSGWAIDLEAINRPLRIGLFVDDEIYATTRTQLFRSDIRDAYGGSGRAGFAFELNCDLLIGVQRRFRVECLDGQAKLKGNEGVIRGRPRGKFDPQLFLSTARRAVEQFVHMPSIVAQQPSLAIIVLNLDGARLLEQFLASFASVNTHPQVEILIVDHGSADDSRHVAERFRSKLRVRFIERGRNYSFSDSNNFGATQTNADILVFANNDIVFTEDVISALVQSVNAPDVGAVGIKLVGRPVAGVEPVEHIGVHFDPNCDALLPVPFETRPAPHLTAAASACWNVPATTAALMACRAELFHSLGGFDTAFHYGYEDVDFCLRATIDRDLRIICRNDVSAVHQGGATRYDQRRVSSASQQRNHQMLLERWARPLCRAMRHSLFEKPGFWTTHAPVVAFAVSESSNATAAGDFYTAKEMGTALATRLGCHVTYLEPADWYNLAGVDLLFAMLPSYDLRRASRQNLAFTAVAWARNWFEEWAVNPSIDAFHMLWASSEIAADFLKDKLKRDVSVVRLATNFKAFSSGRPQPAWSCDCMFAGNYHDDARDVEYALSQLFEHDVKVFGHNWERAMRQPKNPMGPLAYDRMPDAYASVKVVIDDANSSTGPWGSVNSRVYDALAAGRLVITNGDRGVKEVFGDAFPVYQNPSELDELLEKYIGDDEARTTLAAHLRAKVHAEHTYAHRAEQFIDLFREHNSRCLRIGIKIAAPSASTRNHWGDYHFARGIAEALGRQGHVARIDTLDQWYGPLSFGDDCTLVLRGLTEFKPRTGQVNLAWVISHPESVSPDELRRYDHVFVASTSYVEELAQRHGISASPLLQCTDPDIFDSETASRGLPAYDVLFVGNSRNELRTSVRLALEAGYDLAIFGSGWEGLVPPQVVKGQYVANASLPVLYRDAGVVLVDHWDDMRRCGFISNRIFDAAAVGARIVSDRVADVSEAFGVSTYDDTLESFREAVDTAMNDSAENRKLRVEVSQRVRREHSFEARAARLADTIQTHLSQAMHLRG